MKLTDAENAADGIFFPALEQNMMGAVLINENDEVMFFNPAAEKLWGYKREEVIGNNIDMLIPRDLRPAHPEYIRHNREGGKARVEGMSRELQLEKKDGSKIWTRFALSKVSAEGKVYYLALVRDASVEMAQKEQTRQLIIAVDHLDRPVIVLDPERHIVQCNRAFTEMFGYCISEASGMQPDTLLNIPEFPADNRIRLQQLLWKTARDQDEFLLLTRTGEKIWIKASISPVYDVLAHLQNLVMTFSDNDVGKNRDYLLSTAHNAMDYIRKNGGNGWQFFSPAMNEMVKERLVLGAALKEAISNNQLKLVYQPQIFAETGELYGIEALARWHDPQHGHVPPSRFIPLAEEIGEIENIGRWVIAEACRQLAEWRSQNIHIPALSVNLSALHFRSNQLPNQVSDAMQAWGIDGHQLTVEITESMMMEHDTEIFKRIQILRDMGVGLSVDDFGTGFSGLSRLVSLPVTEIKIDKSFVDRCLTEKRILALLEAITSIGQSLNLTVVAEGVETKEQFEMLRKIHCRVIQGYFFSRPLPAEEIPGWMSSVLPLKI
ncbi:EAL domain-containing protein [Shigella sonnei]|nr:EAL domain-containing protein [Shigella sonnei]EFY4401511.1 EAL domain-containing protein [Shigella sonnei]